MTSFLKIVRGYLRPVSESNLIPLYYQTYTPGVTITSGTPITLPAAQTYVGTELHITVNNVPQTYLLDFNFVGSGTKTQISFTYNLLSTDIILFWMERANS